MVLLFGFSFLNDKNVGLSFSMLFVDSREQVSLFAPRPLLFFPPTSGDGKYATVRRLKNNNNTCRGPHSTMTFDR